VLAIQPVQSTIKAFKDIIGSALLKVLSKDIISHSTVLTSIQSTQPTTPLALTFAVSGYNKRGIACFVAAACSVKPLRAFLFAAHAPPRGGEDVVYDIKKTVTKAK
jgi:hypothetical protein